MAQGHTGTGCNEVLLVGRVSASAEQRTLPSGDQLVTFRVVVPRERGRRTKQKNAPVVDAIDIACFSAVTRRRATSLDEGDRVEVRGALRRRFFRTAGGPQSRYDVEATSLRSAAAE